MERIVLVHGSVVGGRATWAAQRPLADRFELVVVDRPGFPPNPPVDRVDFERDAELVADLLEPGDHLVGHSYGGVISLLAAAARPDALRSLTVIEPPATQVAAGDPAVDGFAAGGRELYASGSDERPGDVPPQLPRRGRLASRPSHAASARARAGRAGTHRPARTVGGGDPARRARRRRRSRSSSSPGRTIPPSTPSATSLERELFAERVVLPGYGHIVQLSPGLQRRAGCVPRSRRPRPRGHPPARL